jgi:hypothetical protein
MQPPTIRLAGKSDKNFYLETGGIAMELQASICCLITWVCGYEDALRVESLRSGREGTLLYATLPLLSELPKLVRTFAGLIMVAGIPASAAGRSPVHTCSCEPR